MIIAITLSSIIHILNAIFLLVLITSLVFNLRNSYRKYRRKMNRTNERAIKQVSELTGLEVQLTRECNLGFRVPIHNSKGEALEINFDYSLWDNEYLSYIVYYDCSKEDETRGDFDDIGKDAKVKEQIEYMDKIIKQYSDNLYSIKRIKKMQRDF